MPISFEIDRAKDFTTFTIQGEISLSELLDAMDSYVKSGVTHSELYDVRQQTGERLTSSDIDAVVHYFRRSTGVRPANSKTAVLVADVLDYGISRMIQILTEVAGVPFKVEVFRSLEKALAWLEVEPSQET